MGTGDNTNPNTARAADLTQASVSGLMFFFLLYGYFLLRPLREAMGVERSMGDLRSLFITTCIVSLAITLVFGGVVSRLNRRTFIARGYRAVIACLVVFSALIFLLPDQYKLYSGYVFYVWLSVVNLFMVSVFWAFMADTWTLEQGKRLFPAIGIGGTIGALLGSITAWNIAESISPVIQMLAAGVCFELSVQAMRFIDTQLAKSTPNAEHQKGKEPTQVGGSWHEGAVTILRSPYLLGIGAWIVFMAMSSTLLYFTQARLVSDASDELNERIALFAQLDLWTQLATLLTQLFVTSKLIRWIGVGATLCVLPVLTVLGFVALAWTESIQGIEPWQVFAVFATFNALHRAARYAVARPARETLFSVVSRAEKYKAKPIVDVFLYRGGDVAGVGLESALAATAVGLWGIAIAAAPLAALWGTLSIALAYTQIKRAQSNN